MSQQSDFLSNLYDFLYPHSPDHNQFKPEDLIFNANLQDFSQRVSYICNLQTNGKLSPQEAYNHIQILWKQLKSVKKNSKSAN